MKGDRATTRGRERGETTSQPTEHPQEEHFTVTKTQTGAISLRRHLADGRTGCDADDDATRTLARAAGFPETYTDR